MYGRVLRAATATLAWSFTLFAAAACGENTVAPPVTVPSLTITAPSGTVYEGDEVALAAVYRDANGVVVPGAPIVWSLSDTLRAQLGNNGAVLALLNGVVRVKAHSNGVTASYYLTIVRAPVQNVVVLLATPVLTRGDVAFIGVKSEGPGGRVLTGRLVTLSSDNPSVAFIDASGRVRGVSAGTTTIRATAEGVVGSAQIQVTADNTVLNLTQMDGQKIPLLVAEDSVWYDGEREFHELYLEFGQFLLSGTPLRYDLQMRIAEYKVTTVNGQRNFQLRFLHRDRDRGLIEYDARGDLQLTSEVMSPLSHVATPLSGGMLVRYRIPGTDDYQQLFFRREPE